MALTVLITGAGSGLGRLTAFDLARGGRRVIAGVQIWPQAGSCAEPPSARDLVLPQR